MWAGKIFGARCALSVMYLLQMAMAGAVPSQSDPRRSISQEAIRNAIATFVDAPGWGELSEAARFDWPKSLPTAGTDAQPLVIGVVWDRRQQAAQFHLRCEPRSACLDFLVHVGLPKLEADVWQRLLSSTTSLQAARASGSAISEPLLAHRGKPATLVLDGGGVRVSLPVTCTEPGTLHQRIRVFDKQSGRVFFADVIGEGLLHASL